MSPNRLSLRPQDLKQVLNRYLERLREHREAMNRLNVYPVPDGDTGTNMTLTVEAVVAEVESAESMEEVAAALAHGALMGAQGNSGIILSQILRASEVITIVTGVEAVTQSITSRLGGDHADVAVDVVYGGQPLDPYLFGVE
jgi:dihydroxyacetone kinase-like predicted kinase